MQLEKKNALKWNIKILLACYVGEEEFIQEWSKSDFIVTHLYSPDKKSSTVTRDGCERWVHICFGRWRHGHKTDSTHSGSAVTKQNTEILCHGRVTFCSRTSPIKLHHCTHNWAAISHYYIIYIKKNI